MSTRYLKYPDKWRQPQVCLLDLAAGTFSTYLFTGPLCFFQHLGLQFLEKIDLGHLLKAPNYHLKLDKHSHIHTSIIHESKRQSEPRPQCSSTNEWINKMWYAYTGNCIQPWKGRKFWHTQQGWMCGHDAKWNKAVTKRPILCDCPGYMRPLRWEVERWLLGLGAGEVGRSCL